MLDVREKINKDYFFSRYFSIWGWATWKRAWVHNDVEISTWRKDITPESINFLSDKPYILKHFEKIFDFVTQNDLDAWGYQWSYNCLFNNGLCLTPSINLIKNIYLNQKYLV